MIHRPFLQPTAFVRGEEAAGLFYEGNRCTREAAVSPSVQHLLQDKGTVQAVDGAETLETRPGPRRIVVDDFAWDVLTRTACRRAGLPREVADVRKLSSELGMMIDHVAKACPGNWNAQWRRRVLLSSSSPLSLSFTIRTGAIRSPPVTSSVTTPIWNHSSRRSVASTRSSRQFWAGFVSPSVGVGIGSWRGHRQLAWASAVGVGIGSWRGHRFDEGDRVILDLHGICHDRRLWTGPDSFQLERFRGFVWDEHPNMLIAQDAGTHSEIHRCPGEWSTVELLKRAVRLLAGSGLDVPRSGFVFHHTGRPGSDI